MISTKRKPVKAITDSFSPLPHAKTKTKVEKWLFTHLCTPMGYPMANFHFFLIGSCEWSIVSLISSKRSGNFSFFFIIFPSFLSIFSKTGCLGPFSTFYAPPWTTPDPLWPEFVPPHPLGPTNLNMILRIKTFYNFWIFLVKLSFLPFLSILAPKDLLLRAGLSKWGL